MFFLLFHNTRNAMCAFKTHTNKQTPIVIERSNGYARGQSANKHTHTNNAFGHDDRQPRANPMTLIVAER
jgi:uncharacterized protein involved in tellurium resistance